MRDSDLFLLKVAAIFAMLLVLAFTAAWVAPDETTKQIDADTARVKFVPERIVDTIDVSGTYEEIGEFELTAYCPCEICCEEWATNRPDGIVYTASGAIAQEGVTIGADPDVFPYGTELMIDGHVYVVQDTGGALSGNRLDVYHATHEAALNFGLRRATVYKRVEEGGED